MLTATFIIAVIALVLTLVAAASPKVPLWVPMIFLCVVAMLLSLGVK